MMPPRNFGPFALTGSAQAACPLLTGERCSLSRLVPRLPSPGLWISCLAIFIMFTCHRHPANAVNLPLSEYSFSQVIQTVQPKIVKIFGAGGLRGLESYQTGFLVSSAGHVLTVWSYVLDTEVVTVVLDDGRKFQGQVIFNKFCISAVSTM